MIGRPARAAEPARRRALPSAAGARPRTATPDSRAPDAPLAGPEPRRDCPLCPRLVAYRAGQPRRAPGLVQRPRALVRRPKARGCWSWAWRPGAQGANRTGRPFTGDYAGVLLYETLLQVPASPRGHYAARPDDGLELVDCMITNAVRCAPPRQQAAAGRGGRPAAPFLTARLAALPRLQGHRHPGRRLAAQCAEGAGPEGQRGGRRATGSESDAGPYRLLNSYHCSRLNTNTGRLTPGDVRGGVRLRQTPSRPLTMGAPPPEPATLAPSPPGRPAGKAALAFIFITVLLDMMALGMVAPVLPQLVTAVPAAAAQPPARWCSACSTRSSR